MPRNIVDADQFPEIVRAPANNDFANETIIGYLAQDLADRTRWLFNRLGIGSAPAARKVDTGDGLTGGGDLTIDRTHRVLAADASIAVGPTGVKVGVLQTDAQHGNLGGGAAHAAAISGGASGFMTGAQVLQLATVVASNANKADLSYVDAIAQGLDPKGSVDAVALTNLTLSGLQTVDGKSLTAGMRVGAFGQTAGADRGIYVVSAGAWTRALDADTSAKVTTGLYTWTATGANKGGWWLTTPDPITLGTTALTFERYTFGLSSSTPPAIGQTSDAGLSDTTSARGQHTHAHGAQPIGTGDNHAVATTALAGFMSAAQVTRLAAVYERPIATVASSRDATLTDREALMFYTGATDGLVTIQPDTTVSWPSGSTLYLSSGGNGGLATFASGAGVVFVGLTGVTAPQGTVVKASRLGGNTWAISWLPGSVASATKPGLMSAADKTRVDNIYVRPVVNISADYNFVAADTERTIVATAANLTAYIQTDATVNLPLGSTLVLMSNAGASAGSRILNVGGVTLQTKPGENSTIQAANGCVRATKVAANTWIAENVPARASVAAQSVGAANALGSAQTWAPIDHVHAHGAQTDPTMHAVATAAAAGFQSATDKAREDLLYEMAGRQELCFAKVNLFTGFGTSSSWGINTPSGGPAPFVPLPTQNYQLGSGYDPTPTQSQASQSAYVLDLADAMPARAFSLRRLSVSIARTVNDGNPATKVKFFLVSMDKAGNRTVIAGQADSTSTAAAYTATHDNVWSGEIVVDPNRRYLLEVYQDTSWPGAVNGYTQIMAIDAVFATYGSIDSIVYGLAPFGWYRADSVTLSGANVSALKNKALGATDTFTVTGTVAAPTADAAMLGQPSLNITAQYADSSRPAADWKFLTDGSGGEIIHVFVPTALPAAGVIHSNGSSGGTWTQLYVGASGGMQADIYNAGGATGLTSLNAGTLVIGVPSAIDWSLGGTGVGLTTNTGVGGGNFAAAPGAATPPQTLRLWAQGGGIYGFVGRWAETLIFNRVLTALERQYVREYVQARYGVTALVVPAAMKRILARAPKSVAWAESVSVSGGNVTAIHDLARHGATYAQATGANQVPAPAAVSGLYNGRPVLTSTGGAKRYAHTALASHWAFSGDGTSHESWSVARGTSNAGARVIKAASTGGGSGFYLSANANASLNNSSVFRAGGVAGTFPTVGYTINVPFIARQRHASASSPNMTSKTTGVTEATANYALAPTAGATQHAMILLGDNGGVAGWAGDVALSIDFDRLLTAQEATDTYADLAELYGVAA